MANPTEDDWYQQKEFFPSTRTIREKERMCSRDEAPSRKKPSPEKQQIDLHGNTREESRALLDSFIAESLKRNCQRIIVIHGKGMHSEKSPVLKDFVGEYLKNHPRIKRTRPAPPKHGAEGATIAQLKY